jgi:Bacterial antitoxin of type II TA system, VapB
VSGTFSPRVWHASEDHSPPFVRHLAEVYRERGPWERVGSHADEHRARRRSGGRGHAPPGIRTKRAVVEEALRTLIGLKRQEEILALRSKLHWEGDLDQMRRD